jgi:hypothetical protein
LREIYFRTYVQVREYLTTEDAENTEE